MRRQKKQGTDCQIVYINNIYVPPLTRKPEYWWFTIGILTSISINPGIAENGRENNIFGDVVLLRYRFV